MAAPSLPERGSLLHRHRHELTDSLKRRVGQRQCKGRVLFCDLNANNDFFWPNSIASCLTRSDYNPKWFEDKLWRMVRIAWEYCQMAR